MLVTAKLLSGLIVGNFNSLHQFTFDDGTVLPAVSPDVANNRRFRTIENKSYHSDLWDDIELVDELDEVTIAELTFCAQNSDVLLVSRRMREAAERSAGELPNFNWLLAEKLITTIRSPHIVDMEKKICSSTSFCV